MGCCGFASGVCSSVAEGCVAVEALGEEFSCGFEFVADESEAEEPGSHGVFLIFILLRFCACALDRLGELAECKAKLNVSLELPGVDAALAFFRGVVELEKPELDRALGEGGVEVEHMVSALVVMVVSAVVCSVAAVPDVRQLAHGRRLSLVEHPEEVGVGRFAVGGGAVAVNVDCLDEKVFVACHDVCEVSEGLGVVAVCSDVNVNSASVVGVADCSGFAQAAGNLLKVFNVLVGENWGSKLRLLVVVPCPDA